MAQNNRHSPPPSKPTHPDARELAQRLEALEKLVRDTLDEKNLWNAKVREWIGKNVEIVTLVQSGANVVISGELLWIDRYTLCIEDFHGEMIVHKGAIATIRQHPRQG